MTLKSENGSFIRLFDNIGRYKANFRNYSESSFDYLNKSARPEIDIVRSNIEEWFNRYQSNKKEDLYERLRSRDDLQHNAALFELFLHDLMLRLGCKIDIHPKVNTKKNRSPDFLVESPNGDCFYIEASILACKSKKEVKEQIILNQLYDYLNSQEEFKSCRFIVGIGVNIAPKRQIKLKDIKKHILDHIKTLDYQKLLDTYNYEQYENIPRWLYKSDDDFEIEIIPAPKYPGNNNRDFIYSNYKGWHLVKRHISIRKTIRDKANSYGKLEYPYIIAINILSSFANKDDMVDAFFGESACQYTFRNLEYPKIRSIRIPNGAWTNKSGPGNKRVSAVLAFNNLYPWNFHTSSVCLYHNPWANNPYNSILTLFPQAKLKNYIMVWSEGKSLASIFGLHKEWPQND